MENIIAQNGMWNNKRLAKLLGQLFIHIQKVHFNATFMASYATKLAIVLFIAL